MDIQEKLLESARATATAAAGVSLALIAVSLYLVSRSINVLVGVVDPISTVAQTTYHSLPFSFLVLSALWPLIIGGLCLLLRVLGDQERKVMAVLEERLSDIPPATIHALNGLSFIANVESNSAKALTNAVVVLPTAALLIHATSLLGSFVVTVLENGWSEQAALRFAVVVAALASVALGLNWAGVLRYFRIPVSSSAA